MVRGLKRIFAALTIAVATASGACSHAPEGNVGYTSAQTQQMVKQGEATRFSGQQVSEVMFAGDMPNTAYVVSFSDDYRHHDIYMRVKGGKRQELDNGRRRDIAARTLSYIAGGAIDANGGRVDAIMNALGQAYGLKDRSPRPFN